MDIPHNLSSYSTEQFLQISSNIVSTFKSKLPVSLCYLCNETDRIVDWLEQNANLTESRQCKINEYCENGLLFVSKNNYHNLADHLSHNLTALLSEHFIDEDKAAQIFYDGILEPLTIFFQNPLAENLNELKTTIALFCEYLWIDHTRWEFFFNTLKREDNIYAHSINTLFCGMAIYLKTYNDDKISENLNSLALGLVLHDLGMTQIPSSLRDKETEFLYKDKLRIQDHVDIAEKMMNRLDIKDDIVKNCAVYHHERLDGSGYRKGKRADSLSKEVRACSIADTFCAMISPRSYREAINPIVAIIIITENIDQYDQELAKSLISFVISNNTDMKKILNDKEKMAQLKQIASKYKN